MKNYLIIGGSSGIGKALVDLLKVNDEISVYATFNTSEINDNEVTYFKHDVLDDEFDLSKVPEQLDGLAYCPGSINLKPFNRFKEQDFIDDFKIQVTGATKIISSVLNRLKKAENPSIVLFSTVAVQQGFPFHSQVSISKGAIEGLTKSLSAEFAPKIRVNAVAPSLTDTRLAKSLLNTDEKKAKQAENNPLKKVGEAEDIAKAAKFLLTNDSSWVTGQIIHVDGGYSSIK